MKLDGQTYNAVNLSDPHPISDNQKIRYYYVIFDITFSLFIRTFVKKVDDSPLPDDDLDK